MRVPRPKKISSAEPGAALRAMREAAALGQRDLAGALGVNQSQISVMENGRRKVPLFLLISCAKLCGYEVTLQGPGRAALTVDGPAKYVRVQARVSAAKSRKPKRGERNATAQS